MKKLLIITLSFLSYFTFAQTGTDCSTAILVSSSGCSAATAYTNAGITGTISPSCFGAGTNNTMWFKFIASSQTVIANVNGGSLTQTMVGLLGTPPAACTGTFPELACNNPSAANSTLTYSALTVGNTYYIVVDGANNLTGTFQLCLSSPSSPTNDSPCSPINLLANNFCSPAGAYSNLGATGETLTSTTLPSCFDATTTMNSVFFTYTAIGTNNTITINGSTTGLNRPQVAILSLTGGCNGTTYTVNGCAQAATGVNSVTLNINNLIGGTTYYILVDGYAANTGSFQICVNSYVPTSAVVNDQCSGAIQLCPNNNYISSTSGATGTNDIAVSKWSCNGVVDNTVWFSFVTTSPVQPINFAINSNCYPLAGSSYDGVIDQYGGNIQFEVFKSTASPACSSTTAWSSVGCVSTPGTSFSSASSGVSSLTIPAASLIANTTYYISVDNFPLCSCDFNFTITGNQGTNAGADQQICLNAAATTMTGFSPAGGTWSGPGVSASGTFTPATAGLGSHVLYYTQGTCTDSKIVTVTGPQVTVSNDVSLCTGQSTTLNGNIVSPTSYTLTSSASPATAIPDGGISSTWTGTGTASSTTFLSSTLTPAGLNAGYSLTSVSLNITHTWDSDVIVYLTNPCGTTIQLIKSNGSSGDNFTNTTFTPSATVAINTGTAPFSSTYIPQGGAAAWATFLACSTPGNFTLKVGDVSSLDAGTLQNWNLTFTNPVTPTTYVWSPTTNMTGSTTLSPTVTPTATTTYTLTATDYNGCTNSDQVIVTINPSLAITVNSPTICNGSSAVLTATGGTTYSWTGGSTANPYTVSPTTTTSYTVTGTTSGCTGTAIATVTVNPLPTITVSNATVCNGTAATITATPSAAGGTYLWTPGGATTASITVTPASTTSYSCVYTLNGCSSLSVSGTVTVKPIPTITVSNTTVCNGTAATITATPSATGGTYLWTPGGATTASLTVTPATTTSYSCVYTLAGCPSPAVSGTVTVNPIPTITVSNATVCNGTAATITATPSATGGTYLWTPGGATTASLTVTPATTTSYSCVYTLNTCPSITVSGTVTVNPIPSITVSNATVCNGTAATITATPSATGGTYLWSPGGATTASLTVTPATTTSYSCVYTLNTCPSASVSGTITVNPIPTITVSNTTVCNGTAATITATPSATGGTYLWTPGGATTASITVTPATTTSYSCVYTLNTCPSASVSGTVTVNPIPTITIPNATICAGGSGTLTATPSATGGTYLWSPGGETTNTITYSPAATTSYSCIYTLNSCPSNSVSASIIVTPSPTMTVSNTTVCDGTPGTITATPSAAGGSYLWSTGATTASITASPSTTTTYTLTYTYTGCPVLNGSGTITVNPVPTITVSNATVCNGTAATITATPSATGGTYFWTPGGATTASITVTPATTTSYSCVYTLNGCPSPAVSGTVTVNPVPSISISNATVCDGTAATITATPSTTGGTYLWSPGGETTPSITNTPSSTTTYSSIYTLNGCSSTSVSGTITVNPVPTITVSNATVCNGTAATITATPSATGGTYLWTPGGATTALITVTPATTTSYSCVYTLNTCPSNSVSGTVTVNPIPTITVSNATVCNGTAATITATPSATGGSYLWSPGGETTSSITVNPSSTSNYSCIYTLNSCSSTSKTGTVTVNSIPTINVSNGTVCNGTAATITATPSANGGTYLWSPGGETTASISVTPTTTTSYSCIYTLNTCPSTSVTGTVTVNTTPTITVSNANVCKGNPATITATPSANGGTYLWTPGGETTSSITVTPSSTSSFSCIYTLAGCSSNSVSGSVTVNQLPTITASSNGPLCEGFTLNLTASNSPATGTTYSWTGPNFTSSSQNPTILNATPSNSGTYTVSTAANGCNSTSTVDVVINATPQVNFNANILSGCVPLKVTFTNTTNPLNGSVVWDFGDGTTSNSLNNVTHTFMTADCFDIKLTSTSNNCTNNLLLSDYICAKAQAVANFSVDNVSHSIINPTFEFTNTSQNATLFNWMFGDGTTSSLTSPSHTYPNEVLNYNVTLIANNADNCADSLTISISVTDELIYYIPNTMTPDGDKFNETFQPVFSAGVDIYSYSMYIYDRWGELLFESHDMKKGWDGTYGGHIVEDDTYVWKIIFKETTSDKKIMRVGHVNVLK